MRALVHSPPLTIECLFHCSTVLTTVLWGVAALARTFSPIQIHRCWKHSMLVWNSLFQFPACYLLFYREGSPCGICGGPNSAGTLIQPVPILMYRPGMGIESIRDRSSPEISPYPQGCTFERRWREWCGRPRRQSQRGGRTGRTFCIFSMNKNILCT